MVCFVQSRNFQFLALESEKLPKGALAALGVSAVAGERVQVLIYPGFLPVSAAL